MKRTIVTLSLVLLVLIGSLSPIRSHAGFSLFSSHTSIEAKDGAITIPVADVSDGEAHYYAFHADDATIHFFVLKSGDGVIRAAFDACDVCFPAKKGYSKQGDFMICNNCGRRFHTSRINVEEGGCNPAPLRRSVVGAHLVIKVDDLTAGRRFF